MIYEVYLNGLLYTIDCWKKLKELIDCSEEDDKFICIHTREQEESVKSILDDPSIISYHSPEYFQNGNVGYKHTPRLKLLILGKKKVEPTHYV